MFTLLFHSSSHPFYDDTPVLSINCCSVQLDSRLLHDKLRLVSIIDSPPLLEPFCGRSYLKNHLLSSFSAWPSELVPGWCILQYPQVKAGKNTDIPYQVFHFSPWYFTVPIFVCWVRNWIFCAEEWLLKQVWLPGSIWLVTVDTGCWTRWPLASDAAGFFSRPYEPWWWGMEPP